MEEVYIKISYDNELNISQYAKSNSGLNRFKGHST